MKTTQKSNMDQKLFQIDPQTVVDFFHSDKMQKKGWHLVIPPTDWSAFPPELKHYWEGYALVQQSDADDKLLQTIRIPLHTDSPRYALDMQLALLAIANLEGKDILEMLDRFAPYESALQPIPIRSAPKPTTRKRSATPLSREPKSDSKKLPQKPSTVV